MPLTRPIIGNEEWWDIEVAGLNHAARGLLPAGLHSLCALCSPFCFVGLATSCFRAEWLSACCVLERFDLVLGVQGVTGSACFPVCDVCLSLWDEVGPKQRMKWVGGGNDMRGGVLNGYP